MRIPANSNFSTEIAKKFRQIFHKDMTLGGLQNLQEELNLINPVDTHLVNQVSKLNKGNGHEPTTQKNVSGSRKVRQDNSQGKRFIDSPFKAEAEKEELAV
jgi:hypothetical protein